MNPVFYVAIALLLFFVIYEIIIMLCFKFCFKRNGAKEYVAHYPDELKDALNKGRQDIDKAKKELVEITSEDGLKLKGYLIRGSLRPDITVINFHGYRSSIYDFAGSFGYYEKIGCNVLYVYQRAHGLSEGKYITFGIKECSDAVLWAKFAEKTLGGKIILGGISMGATTVMLTANKNIPGSVIGIVADCGFTSPYDIIKSVAKRYYKVPEFMLPLVMNSLDFYCKTFAGFSVKADSTVKTLAEAKIPVVLSHGDADTFVPSEMSVLNSEACKSKCVFTLVKGAKHGYAYAVDPDSCYRAVSLTFFNSDLLA